MTVDREPAGDVATATLVARELDTGAARQAHGDAPAHCANCANCGSGLIGAYCHQCGQFSHVHRSLWHIAEEALHGILHFDTKIFRTIPLLFVRPGLLTRRYIDGQRARYVAPFGLFLFNVFFLFFASALLSEGNAVHVDSGGTSRMERAELVKEVEEQEALVAQYTAELAAATSAGDRESAREDLRGAQIALKALSLGLAGLDSARGSPADGREQPREPSTVAVLIKTAQNALELESWFPALAHTLDRALENPDLALYKLKNASSKFAFLLVPIALPFLWLMFFWRDNVTVYDHAIFALYSLSFMSLWTVLMASVGSVALLDGLVPLMAFYPLVHVFLQLKETYGLGMFSAFWRTAALTAVTGLASVMFLLLIVLITFH
jgi:hypothetical protein